MLVNMVIVGLMMGLMATSFAQLSSAQFSNLTAYRTGLQAYQLAEAKANEIGVTSYSALAAEARATVTGASPWQRQVILGAPVALGGGGTQRTVTINVYYGSETSPRATINKYPTSAGTAAGVPSGTIAIWSGSAATIPSGWVLCNGANGTPDLRSRFVYGADSWNSKAAWAAGWNVLNGHFSPGISGGEEMHYLTVAEMPNHTHSGSTTTAGGAHYHGIDIAKGTGLVYGSRQYSGPASLFFYSASMSVGAPILNSGVVPWRDESSEASHSWVIQNVKFNTDTGNSAHTHDLSITYTGGNGAHYSMPPFLSLCYIMKT